MMANLFTRISIIKQNKFCNINAAIYISKNYCSNKDDVFPYQNLPAPLQYDIITSSDDLLGYLQNVEIKNKIQKFRYLLDKNCKLYIAIINDNIVGYYWVAELSKFKPYLYTKSKVFNMEIPVYFIFFCKTFEAYRNLGIYSSMLNQICNDLNLNESSIIISTDLTNLASQRGIEKAGFKKICNLRYLNIGGVKLIERVSNSPL